jgi:hypothetical protein
MFIILFCSFSHLIINPCFTAGKRTLLNRNASCWHWNTTIFTASTVIQSMRWPSSESGMTALLPSVVSHARWRKLLCLCKLILITKNVTFQGVNRNVGIIHLVLTVESTRRYTWWTGCRQTYTMSWSSIYILYVQRTVRLVGYNVCHCTVQLTSGLLVHFLM